MEARPLRIGVSAARRSAVAAALLAAGCGAAEDAPEDSPCAFGEILDEDGGACVPEACGSGPWGDIDRSGDVVVHVAPWGNGDGNGSESEPLDEIQQGADEAGEAGGGLVALAAGSYLENLEIDGTHDGVEIAGRCAALVTLDGSEGLGDELPAVDVLGGSVTLRGLTITRGGRGLRVDAADPGGSASATIRDLVLDANVGLGLRLAGAAAEATLAGVLVARGESWPDGSGGGGIDVASGARVAGEDVVLEDNRDLGLFAYGAGTEVEIDGLRVAGTRPLGDGLWGRAIEVDGGASLTARDLLVDGNASTGVYADGPGTRVVLEDAVIRDSAPLDGSALGLDIGNGAELEAEGLRVERVRYTALMLWGEGSNATLSDALFSDTLAAEDGSGGFGIQVAEGAVLSGDGVRVERARTAGIHLAGAGTSAELHSTELLGTEPDARGGFGGGVGVLAGASLSAEGLLVEANRGLGLLAGGAGIRVSLRDSQIRGTLMSEQPGSGSGLASQDGALIEAESLQVLDCAAPGLSVLAEGELRCSGCLLRGNGFAGAVLLRGTLRMDASEIAANRPSDSRGGGVGLFAWGEFGPPDVDLDDVTFSGHAGPAIYLRGPGRYGLSALQIDGSALSAGGWEPVGGLVAVSGIAPWSDGSDGDSASGLRIVGSRFSQMAGHAILLDGSGALLDGSVFESVAGLDVWQQHCDAAKPLLLLEGELRSNDCEGFALPLEPLLWYVLDAEQLDVEG